MSCFLFLIGSTNYRNPDRMGNGSSEDLEGLLVILILRLDRRSKVLLKKLPALGATSQATTRMNVLR